MGYRSDVFLRIAEPLVEVVQAAAKLDPKLEEILKDGESDHGAETDFYWESVKWYDSYPEIQAIEGMLDDLDEDDFGFIRLGEDRGDIEERGYPSEYGMYTSTTVDWQVSMKKTEHLGRLITDNDNQDKPLGVIVDGYDFDNNDHQYESVFKIKRIDGLTMMLFMRQSDSFLIV